MNLSPLNNNINIQQKDPNVIKEKMNNIGQMEDDKKLMEVCRDFESIFVQMMLKEMRNTIHEDGFVEKSQGTKIFEEMHMEELAKEMTKGDNSIGIAKMMYEQFKRRV